MADATRMQMSCNCSDRRLEWIPLIYFLLHRSMPATSPLHLEGRMREKWATENILFSFFFFCDAEGAYLPWHGIAGCYCLIRCLTVETPGVVPWYAGSYQIHAGCYHSATHFPGGHGVMNTSELSQVLLEDKLPSVSRVAALHYNFSFVLFFCFLFLLLEANQALQRVCLQTYFSCLHIQAFTVSHTQSHLQTQSQSFIPLTDTFSHSCHIPRHTQSYSCALANISPELSNHL